MRDAVAADSPPGGTASATSTAAAPLLPRSIEQLTWLGVYAGSIQALRPYIVLLPEVVRWLFGFVGGGIEAALSTGIHEVKSGLYGVVIILFLRFEPRGLVGVWTEVKRLWVHWPLRY